MATLVLNTVGTMLGGPVGGAIGGLVGQSIDQQLFGAGARHGPRLGDLAVQTSSYGSAVPQIFGKMRVAGTIVWSTDLQEQSETQPAKNQPDTVTYSYSVSLAVALSSRPINGIGRVWADGKLIRTSDGVFSVPTDFRVCDGSEDQPVDPLIGSAEGLDSTPAYRGLALAVFENLEIADFGNRIPFLTFEVVADETPMTIGSVLGEVSAGAIASTEPTTVVGYAAHGPTVSAAIEPLMKIAGVALFDDGTALVSPMDLVEIVDEGEGGCTADGPVRTAMERSQEPASNLPSTVALSFYDPDREYQAGVARASDEASRRSVDSIELPAAVQAGEAKALAQSELARRWAERDRLTLRLPPKYFAVHPGALVQPAAEGGLWRVEQLTVDSLATVLSLRAAGATGVNAVAADPGRIVGSTAIIPEPTSVTIMELPDDESGGADAPVVVVGATGTSPWRSVPLQVEVGGASYTVPSARRPAVTGSALTILEAGETSLFDLLSSVDVRLEGASNWLESRDDDALTAGANAAILGSEIIQFGDATPVGDGVFRLTRLLRGRRGSEWATGAHEIGETFMLLERGRVVKLPLSRAAAGSVLRVTPAGLADPAAVGVEFDVSGEAMRPLSPVHLRASYDAGGNLVCTWTRRSRLGLDWLNGVDAPLGCALERYKATLTDGTLAITIEAAIPEALFTAEQVQSLAGLGLELSVVQVGDYALSRPASLQIVTEQE